MLVDASRHEPSPRCTRRRFLELSGSAAFLALADQERAAPHEAGVSDAGAPAARPDSSRDVTLFLCGDVMTGRGIDQVLAHPSKPALHESYVASALEYVELAEKAHGPVPRPASFSYVWGDALAELDARAPDLRMVNLETSVTTSEKALPKGINYRMHPGNVACLRAARLDCCVLANNHVLDWDVAGLVETLETLDRAGIATAGAGRNLEEARRPAALEAAGKARVGVFGLGSTTSGIPRDWAAGDARPGVELLPDLSARSADLAAERVRRWRRPGDLVLASIHWGGNWGYDVPREQRDFAHHLVDAGGADVVHGHSSHHPKAVDVYEGRPILYGCGDFLNDYEGISGYEEFRSNLVLAYFVTLDAATGRLARLEMTPFRTRRFRLERVGKRDAEWLRETLTREGRAFGTALELAPDGTLSLRWS